MAWLVNLSCNKNHHTMLRQASIMFILTGFVLIASTATPSYAGARAGIGREEQPKEWPCDQIYKTSIPLATIWQGPDIKPYKNTWWENERLFGVLEQLENLTLTEQQVDSIIATFVANGSKETRTTDLNELFSGIYERLSQNYTRQLEGILRFTNRQKKLAQKVSQAATKLREQRKKGFTLKDPEYKEAESDLEWITRVFDERKKLTPYICEEPVFLQQQLGFRARAIQKHLTKN